MTTSVPLDVGKYALLGVGSSAYSTQIGEVVIVIEHKVNARLCGTPEIYAGYGAGFRCVRLAKLELKPHRRAHSHSRGTWYRGGMEGAEPYVGLSQDSARQISDTLATHYRGT